MSSFIAHAAVGYSIAAHGRVTRPRALAVLGVVASLAPDLDYGVVWLTGSGFEPRLTHSVAFCGAWAWLSYLALYRWERREARYAAWVVFLAGLSHLVLDLLVGVHGSPLAWPLLEEEVRSPMGVLPSAGRLSLGNAVMWRNLALEALVLAAPVVVLLSRRRAGGALDAARSVWWLWPISAVGMAISASLAR